MRIAYVYDAAHPWVRGGAQLRYWELARRLADRHDVHYLSWQFWQGPARIVREGVLLHGVGRPPSLYGRDGKRTVREALAFSIRVMPALLRERWDVVDCSATPYLPLYAARAATWATRTPLVATWHEFWGPHWRAYLPARPIVARVAEALERAAVPLADHRLAVSEFTAARLGDTELPSSVVGNGVDLAGMGREQPARRVTDIVCVGRLIDEKRVDLLIDAVVQLVATHPRIRCDVVGDGPELGRLRGLAAERGVARNVTFAGEVDHASLVERLHRSKLLVMPSIREGFGVAVAEAQACGTVPVVVASPMSAAPALVRDGIDGLICSPTPAGIAAAVDRLLGTPAQRRRMAQAAREVGQSRDWDEVAERVEQIYLSVARRQPAAVTA